MTRYRKKPIEIDAIQFDGTEECTKKIIDEFGYPFLKITYHKRESTGDPVLYIYSLEGRMVADVGDWIIRSSDGEVYPYAPEVFAQIYEPVTNCNTLEQMENLS